MAYVSLYRKYRSQTFDDVMGQDHVTRTIRNAITAGRIGQAYLFCGSRGTGKTTVARLIAKAVNCANGPTAEPCNQCSACVSITEGSAVDIVELDAASNRKVEDIDALRDGVKYPPMQLRYKVYIIDEAHQLSSHAKDAFLKTLEEPPPHAIFILATTEAHEIPLTIRSRCQQFDFRRGSDREIGERLRYVATSEGATIEEDALAILSDAAAGSWRDGLSILEQVMTYTEGRVTAEDVGTVLGTIDDAALQEIGEVVASRDAAAAFQLAGRLVEEGKDIRQLLRSITAHFRRLLLAAVGASSDARAAEQAARFARGKLLRLVELFAGADKEMRFNDQHRLVLELTLLKALEDPATAEPGAPRAAEHAPAAQPPPARPAPPPPPPPAAPKPPEPPKAPEAVKEPAPEPVDPDPEEQAAPEPMVSIAEEQTSPKCEAEETEAVEPAADGEVTFAAARAAWPKAMVKVKAQNKPMHAIAYDGTPLRLQGSTLVLGFDTAHRWHSESLTKSAQVFAAALSEVMGRQMKVRGVVDEGLNEEPLPLEPAPAAGQPSLLGETDEFVDKVLDMFGGQIVNEPEEKNSWEESGQ